MKNLLILAFIANMLLQAVSLWLLPPVVAIHFGSGGEPDGWASAYINALSMTGVNALLFPVFYFAPLLVRNTPAKWINLPNKAYWLQDDRREKAEKILADALLQYGTATYAFMFFVGMLAIRANLSEPVRLDETNFFWLLGLYLGYTLFWSVGLIRRFRLPTSHRR